MFEHTCIPFKKILYVLTHKQPLFLSSLTGNHLRLALTASWSLPLISPTHTHTNTSPPGNFSHCSQTPNGRELRGFRDDFRLKDALEDGGSPKCTFVWTHTCTHPDVIPMLLTVKWCFLLKPLILTLPHELGRWCDDSKFRGCRWCAVIRQLTAVIPV